MPEVRSAQALSTAPRSASSSVLAATVRQISRPSNAMQTSHSCAATWNVENTTIATTGTRIANAATRFRHDLFRG